MALNQQVITCEGNAGFYEVGLMTTPLKGWFNLFHNLVQFDQCDYLKRLVRTKLTNHNVN